MTTKKQLVIIPGLGDRGWLYRFIKPLWSLFGYEVHIFVFGWNDEHANFKEAQNRLDTFVKSLGDKVYLIGVSAGGTAAVNTLANHSSSITKLTTVCTPYLQVSELKNELLAQSINQTTDSLTRMSKKTKAKIFSIHSLHDQVVPIQYSQPEGVQRKSLLAV